jgi:hypothetical protein
MRGDGVSLTLLCSGDGLSGLNTGSVKAILIKVSVDFFG